MTRDHRHDTCPNCGGLKRKEYRQCGKCRMASLLGHTHPDAAKERRRQHVNAYMRRYRALKRKDTGPRMDECPSCGGRKWRTNRICQKCDLRAVQAASLSCWVCEVPLREASWHDLRFMRCPSCGLEIKSAPAYTIPGSLEEAA